MKRTLVAVAVTAALFSGGAFAQAAAPAPKAAPKAAAAAPAAEKQLYSQAQYDVLLKERLAQGGQDTPEIRNAVKEELNTRELLAREAKKSGVDKNPDVKTQMDLASQTVLVRAYVSDWIKKNPVPEAELKKEYDAIKGQIGDKEYKVRHILVEKDVRAALTIASIARSTIASPTIISTFTFGRKSTTYSAPRYSSVCPFCRPKPLTSVTVSPATPTSDSASRTSSSLNGLMIASIFFMVVHPPKAKAAAGRIHEAAVTTPALARRRRHSPTRSTRT